MKITVTRGKGSRVRDVKGITKRMLAEVNGIWQEAVREGIIAVMDSDVIEVDTGMAKSTLVPLARAVKMVTAFKATIHPKTDSRKGLTELDGSWNPEGVKSDLEGELEGLNAYKYVIANTGRRQWSLSFTIPVWHYVAHELGVVPGTGPWNSLDIFLDGMIDYLQNVLDADRFLPGRLVDMFFFEGESG